jgi:pyruvate-formate lyase-activating enzyme/very-short-patch-repair endonuclease
MSTTGRLTEPTGKVAELFRNLPGGKVQCTACARLCQIGEGQVGLCGVRGVVGGQLYLLVYGRVMAGHIDPIEKKPVVHYKPGSKIFSIATSGCNWLCHPSGAEILLADGQLKDVEDIIPGDMVWSYDVEGGMRIEPSVVTHAVTRRGRLWEVEYGSNGQEPLLLTEEHPILTKLGWKAVRQLAPGDSILRVWQTQTAVWKEKNAELRKTGVFTCHNCGESVTGYEMWNRHRGGCYTRGLEHPPELLARYSERMRLQNPMRDPEVARRAIGSSKERFLRDPNHGWHANVSRLQSWLHRHPSASQLRLYPLLDEIGLEYEREYRIRVERSLGHSKSYYIADAAFVKEKLDVEVDGWWHYNNPEVQASDRTREETLRANGWDVLRISGSYLFNHPEESKALIIERLKKTRMVNVRYWVDVNSVHPTDRQETVYSIETMSNHNYVADGILVHNCKYCQNFDISQRRKIEGTDAAPKDIVDQALAYECEGLAYTYNQPTIFMEYARDVGKIARSKGIFNIFVSNGFDTPETIAMMDDFLDCITVDFKGSGETGFVRSYIGIPSAEPIFESLLELKRRNKVHVEITDLIVPRVGDSLEAADKLCHWAYDNLGPDTPVHFLRFHPGALPPIPPRLQDDGLPLDPHRDPRETLRGRQEGRPQLRLPWERPRPSCREHLLPRLQQGPDQEVWLRDSGVQPRRQEQVQLLRVQDPHSWAAQQVVFRRPLHFCD